VCAAANPHSINELVERILDDAFGAEAFEQWDDFAHDFLVTAA